MAAPKKLIYAIHQCSSFSSNYPPENILVDNTKDQMSRWSSDSNSPPQYLLLRLEQPAIVQQIHFGKYEKDHVCNIKKFKVYGGLTPDNQIELLDSGLQNDTSAETFSLKHRIGEHVFPCQFIKIVPLQAWGPSFNFSIWYCELRGNDDVSMVKPCMNWYRMYREREAVRLCLKHLRQHDYSEAFEALQRKTRVELEHPLLTQLHDLVVRQGDFDRAEQLMTQACDEGMFGGYINSQDYKHKWTHIEPLSGHVWPGRRGGHQMVLDVPRETLYLLGGWDGHRDLADLWRFSIPERRWTCLSEDTSQQNGPSPRSCHKVCLDPERRQLFTLGRYVDTQFRSDAANLKCDFYVYDLENDKWTLITDDTYAMGGPRLVFDHQVAYDVTKQTIYVFGGRILTPTLLIEDGEQLRSRVGHSMQFHPRHKEELDDFVTVNVDTAEVEVVSDVARSEGKKLPVAGFTQRATLDPLSDEIHVLFGLSKQRDKRQETSDGRNALWVYDINTYKWTCVYKNEGCGQEYWRTMGKTEPAPRFAHQLAYDHVRRVHYLFGGNPGKDSKHARLNDFWELKLYRPSCAHLLRRCRFLIRKQQFAELAASDPVRAVTFLQTNLSELVDHSDPQETSEFQGLTGLLFSPDDERLREDYPLDPDLCMTFRGRSRLFDQLSEPFPPAMTQPQGKLVDLVSHLVQ